jgi:hypothetical protein
MSAELVTYKAGAYCQIKFQNSERVLVSCTHTGIRISKLGFAGLFPIRTIAEWSIADLGTAIEIFANPETPMAHPLDSIKDGLLKTCTSIADVQRLCSSGAA